MDKKATQAASSAGFPLVSILTILFVLAKLFGKVSWSWWWVFAPLWVSTAIFVTVFVVILAISLIAFILD